MKQELIYSKQIPLLIIMNTMLWQLEQEVNLLRPTLKRTMNHSETLDGKSLLSMDLEPLRQVLRKLT